MYACVLFNASLGVFSSSALRDSDLCVPLPQYVPQNLYPVYKNKVVPVADIITPNQFEAEWVQELCFLFWRRESVLLFMYM